MARSINYQDYLLESLKNVEEARGYLNTALEDGDTEVFLLALQNVVKAQGGVAKVADKSHKSRTSLYKALSKNGNPYFESTKEILSAIGMRLSVVVE